MLKAALRMQGGFFFFNWQNDYIQNMEIVQIYKNKIEYGFLLDFLQAVC